MNDDDERRYHVQFARRRLTDPPTNMAAIVPAQDIPHAMVRAALMFDAMPDRDAVTIHIERCDGDS